MDWKFIKGIVKKPVVVIEMSNDWLKMAENSVFHGNRYLTKLGFMKLADIEGSVARAIAKMFNGMKLSKQYVVAYIPRHLVTVRILELPSADPKEVSDMVNLQISKQTPYSKEEIVSAYRTISTEREGYTKVMLVIAQHSIVKERLEALQKIGVYVQKVALSTEGVYNWFSIAYMLSTKSDLQTSILLDIDSNCSDFIIIHKGRLVFTRSISIGANYLLDEPDKWRDKFIEELKHSVELYQMEERDIKIAKIFLAGASRNIGYIDVVLSSALDIPTESIDPIRNIRIKSDTKILQNDRFKYISTSPLFGVAIKHKELEIDLTPNEIQVQRLMDEKRKNLTKTGILSISIIMMGSILFLINIYSKNLYLAQLKTKISQIEKKAGEVEKMRAKINLIEKRLDAKGASINLLNEIFQLVPREIYLTYVNIEEKQRIVLKGSAFAMSDVFRFVTILENSPMLTNVKTTYITTQKDKKTEYAEFEITCSYEKASYKEKQ